MGSPLEKGAARLRGLPRMSIKRSSGGTYLTQRGVRHRNWGIDQTYLGPLGEC